MKAQRLFETKPKAATAAQMAVDWSMANVKILDRMGEDGPAPVAQQPLMVEPSVENMLRVILHTEVPQTRICVPHKADGKEIKESDIGEGCRSKSCITCSAKYNTSGFKKGKFEINCSTILGHWKEMKANT
eukprot:9556219-Heterocapsa_arctica.AAC.1